MRSSHDELVAAFDRLDSLDPWMDTWNGSRIDHARLKNLTSTLIGRFAGAATEATLASAGDTGQIVRFGARVVVPREVQAEIAVLKGIVAAFVMSKNTRQPIYMRQREMLMRAGRRALGAGSGCPRHRVRRGLGRRRLRRRQRRAVVDQVASLTDQSAASLARTPCGERSAR